MNFMAARVYIQQLECKCFYNIWMTSTVNFIQFVIYSREKKMEDCVTFSIYKSGKIEFFFFVD